MKSKRLFSTLVVAGFLSLGAAQASEEDQRDGRDAGATRTAGQAGPMRDPLDPVPARMRAAQLTDGDQRVDSGTRFNPAMSVILDGVYYNAFSGHLESPPGFDNGHDHGGAHGHGHGDGFDDGFQLREAEFAFSASVDPYFDAFAVFVFENGEIDFEEAYITTRSLPAGLQIKAGKFLSDIGYINKQHTHDWAFVDRPWMNEFLFGDHGLQETGMQLTWMPPTRSYTRFGLELLQGESSGVANYIGSGDHEIVTVLPDEDNRPVRNRWRADTGFEDASGPRLLTAFAKWAPDLGYDHALQLGLFGGRSEAYQRMDAHSSGRLETWDGDSRFLGIDVVYKHDGGGPMGHKGFTLQAEYAVRELDLTYMSRQFSDFSTLTPTGPDGDPDVRAQRWKQDGLYIQGVYGFAPRWNAGLRIDVLGLINDAYDAGSDADGRRGMPVEFEPSYRYSLQTSYLPTEFSRLRAQVNYSRYGHEHGAGGNDHDEGAWEFMLQYNISIGVHGAHAF
jgi:hypothetical protein